MTTPEPMTKAWYDAQHNPPQPEPWGFPGAGILALVLIVASLAMAAHTLYLNGKMDGRQECFYDLKGYDY